MDLLLLSDLPDLVVLVGLVDDVSSAEMTSIINYDRIAGNGDTTNAAMNAFVCVPLVPMRMVFAAPATPELLI